MMFASAVAGVRTLGWIVGVVFLGFVAVLPALFVRERYFHRTERQQSVKLVPGIKAAFSSQAFVVLVALTLLQIVAGMFASNLDRYLLVYYQFGGDIAHGETWKGNLSLAYAIVGILAIYPVSWLARRLGKAQTVAVAFALVLVGSLGKWLLFTPGNPYKILIDPLFCGPVWIAINILTPAMLADICDEDELRHGMRREGMYGAIFSWIQKVGYSTAYFGAFLSLKMTGFDAALGGEQTPSTILRLRLILAISTAAWALIAFVLLAIYPLNRRRAHEIRAALEARRGRV
jgi:GPH family glycoside/pentoside/hexuronide:cation symporter